MKFRHGLLALVAFWIAGEFWAFPWSPAFWPDTSLGIQLGVFASLALLHANTRLRALTIDIALITMASRLLATLAWRQWMVEGWFNWGWLDWLAHITQSDGEGAYLMVEYQFFVISFALLCAVRFFLRDKTGGTECSRT